MNKSERIRHLRKSQRLSIHELGRRVGVSHAAISQWENNPDIEIKSERFFKLAQALGVTPAYLMNGSDGEVRESATSYNASSNVYNVGSFETWDSKTPLNDDDVELPFYQEVELSAGIGSEVVREDNGFKLRFSKSSLRKAGVDPSNAACVQIKGDSMLPALIDGATVGVDTSKTSIEDGKMYAIDHAGMLRVKVLHRIPGGLRVRSFNSDEYPDETYKGDELNDIKVIGKVFWSAAFHF